MLRWRLYKGGELHNAQFLGAIVYRSTCKTLESQPKLDAGDDLALRRHQCVMLFSNPYNCALGHKGGGRHSPSSSAPPPSASLIGREQSKGGALNMKFGGQIWSSSFLSNSSMLILAFTITVELVEIVFGSSSFRCLSPRFLDDQCEGWVLTAP
jgi:hypothetical protein